MPQTIGFVQTVNTGAHTQARLTADPSYAPILDANQVVSKIIARCGSGTVADVAFYDVSGVTTASEFAAAPRLVLLTGVTFDVPDGDYFAASGLPTIDLSAHAGKRVAITTNNMQAGEINTSTSVFTLAARSGGNAVDLLDPYGYGNSTTSANLIQATTETSVSLSLSSVPATAFPGQSRTVTGTGFGATQGTGGLTIGGVSQTITSWSDTEIIFTTVQGNNKYEAGKTLEVTTDAAETVSGTIELVADTANGFGYVDMSSPNTSDESSVAFGATPTVVTGDQFEWEDFTPLGNLTVDAQGFVTNVNTEGTFRGRFWDATDSTWGAVETFEASVPGEEDTWPFGKGINPEATKNWTWGRRHPKTNMRVRVYK